MSGEPVVFRPTDIGYDNLEKQIYDAGQCIADNGDFTLDLGRLSEYNTTAICFVIAILRICRQRQCRVDIGTLPDKFKKLLKLYQLDPWVA